MMPQVIYDISTAFFYSKFVRKQKSLTMLSLVSYLKFSLANTPAYPFLPLRTQLLAIIICSYSVLDSGTSGKKKNCSCVIKCRC